MNVLDHSWQRAWSNLGRAAPTGLQALLIAAYREPQRHYHSLQHLEECLAHFEVTAALAQHPGEVEIALWFHDAIYEVQGKHNERLSADWAAKALTASGAVESAISRVDELIMATCHKASPTLPDQRLLVDIDLAILGAAPERFSEYDKQVKQEYSWVPSVLYGFKRKEVLNGFLARPSTFTTPHFQSRLEQTARENLKKAVA